jgi:hypothetical protein
MIQNYNYVIRINFIGQMKYSCNLNTKLQHIDHIDYDYIDYDFYYYFLDLFFGFT